MNQSNQVKINCVYCGHELRKSIAELEKEERVFYREGTSDDSPTRTVEYLINCLNCGRSNIITVKIRGA